MSFVHLHVHSQYSLLRATPTVDVLVKKCKENEMSSIALTDYGNLFGALEFYFKCKENNIQPIIGSELYLTKDRLEKTKKVNHEQSSTIVLLAQNKEGYKNLCRLSTIGYQEGFYYLPRIDQQVLKEHSKNLIALSGGSIGQIYQIFKNSGEEQALNQIKFFKNIFQDRFYLEYTHSCSSDYHDFLKEASRITSIPLVATNDVHYIEKQDYIIQDVLVCIGTNNILSNIQNTKRPDLHFTNQKQMENLFKKEDPSLINLTKEISERCHIEFKVKDQNNQPIYHLPQPPLEAKKGLKSELKYLSEEGLKERIKESSLNKDKIATYKDRLKQELDIINSMGFTGYFLIVHEFVHWAKQEDIPVGPGRGSGASSLVAYCLGITDLDPMPQNLLFERFLNPERISMPDFDIDFCQEHRNRVINHVLDKYGSDYVAQVITFGRLQARAAIRDVGRVLSLSYLEVDAIAKLIPEQLGITIQESLDQNKALMELKQTDSQTSTLIDLAQRIEGLVRHVSIHAAGVIIADQPILDYAPLYRGNEDENVIQFDLKHAEKIGLVKFDFLGLKTLTHIHKAFEWIQKNQKKKIDKNNISLDDPGIYEIMSQGDTLGVFQFEGRGITDLIKKACPTCFEDIIAINALFRPGPMDMIPEYLERRKSKTAKYIFPELESILKETHGIVVYQEQVLLISALIAGFSYAEADILRRAMGKKISSEMRKQKTRFIEGAKNKNYDIKKAEQLFDTVAEFAKYGFNKAHAAAYCVLAAQTAWLKKYYPVEFFSALMSTEVGDHKKLTKYIQNAKRHQIKIQTPHVNESEYDFSARGDQIFFALGAIKGVGQNAVENIVNARNRVKKFESLDHFLESIDSKKVNKKTIDALARAGAFDNLGYDRSDILSQFDSLIQRVEKKKQDQETGQTSLFDVFEEEQPVHLARTKPWTYLEKLNNEKQVIGFYLSQHPLEHFKPYMKSISSKTIQEVKSKNKAEVQIWGMIENLREVRTRKGETMAFATLEDHTGYLDLVFFSSTYLDFEKMLKTDEPLLIGGRMQQFDSSPTCVVEKVQTFNTFLSRVNRLEITLTEQIKDQDLSQLQEIMRQNTGRTSIILKLNTGGESLNMKVQEPSGLNLNILVLENMRKLIPADSFRLL